MTTNVERAEWAQAALEAYQASHASDGDPFTDIGDMIGDSLHLAGRLPEEELSGVPLDLAPIHLLARALNHYLCELDEDEEGNAPMEPNPDRVGHALDYLRMWFHG